jgi:hypothetical protein
MAVFPEVHSGRISGIFLQLSFQRCLVASQCGSAPEGNDPVGHAVVMYLIWCTQRRFGMLCAS